MSNRFVRHYDDPSGVFGDSPLEPSASDYAAARAELGPWSSDLQITTRAFELMAESLALLDANAEEATIDNYNERMEDWT